MHGKWDFFYAIMLSKYQIDLNAPLLGAALCYWDNTSNTFAFGPGPMSPTLLDMVALFGFKRCGMSIDLLGDYELKNCRIEILMKASRTEIVHLITFSGMADCDQEHVMFLLFLAKKIYLPLY